MAFLKHESSAELSKFQLPVQGCLCKPISSHKQRSESSGLGSEASQRLSLKSARSVPQLLPSAQEKRKKRDISHGGKEYVSVLQHRERWAMSCFVSEQDRAVGSLCICCAVMRPEIHACCAVLPGELTDLGLSSSLSYSLLFCTANFFLLENLGGVSTETQVLHCAALTAGSVIGRH